MFEKPTFEKEDLKAVYKEAKEVQSTNTDLKNLRPVLAFMSTFKKYPPTRASITSMYNKLQDSDDSAETKKNGDAVAKAKEFFQCLEQDFDGFISNNHGIPFQPNYSDSFGDWYMRIIGEYTKSIEDGASVFPPLQNCMAQHNLLNKHRGNKTKK